jgi:hypothetical protein
MPALKVGHVECPDNQDKAQVLTECFFPQMAHPTPEAIPSPREEILWELIAEAEIERALRAAKGTTTPSEDGLPMLVWKKIWTNISAVVASIFTASVNLGYYPKRWKSAMIVVLGNRET